MRTRACRWKGAPRSVIRCSCTARNTCFTPHRVQVAWICNATVCENILFGEHYDAVWYKQVRQSRAPHSNILNGLQVVEACSLSADFAALPAGDHTEIGAKGINLSGGQKQRVALARAVYAFL